MAHTSKNPKFRIWYTRPISIHFFPFQFLGSDQPKEQDNSSEENSLSISLPSEGSQNHSNTTTRPAQHLTELRTGILKIFNDAEKVDVDQVDYHQNTSVIHEKYEFESNEKIMSKATNSKSSTAWSSEDRPDDTPFDNDR